MQGALDAQQQFVHRGVARDDDAVLAAVTAQLVQRRVELAILAVEVVEKVHAPLLDEHRAVGDEHAHDGALLERRFDASEQRGVDLDAGSARRHLHRRRLGEHIRQGVDEADQEREDPREDIWIKQLDRGPFSRLSFGGQDRRPLNGRSDFRRALRKTTLCRRQADC